MEAINSQSINKSSIPPATNTVTPQNIENKLTGRTFSVEEAGDIITRAESLQNMASVTIDDKVERVENLLPASESLFKPTTISEETLYKLTKDCKIDPKYVDKIITTTYPPKEKQIQDLKAIESHLDYKILNWNAMSKHIKYIQLYRDELLAQLKNNFTGNKFNVECYQLFNLEKKIIRVPAFGKVNEFKNELKYFPESIIKFYETTSTEKMLNLGIIKIKYSVKEKKLIAKIKLEHTARVSLKLYNPKFISGCGEKLIQLSKKTNTQIDSTHQYEPS